MGFENGNGNSAGGRGQDYRIFEPPSLLEISERILIRLNRQKEACERAIERGNIPPGNLREIRKLIKTARKVRAVCERGRESEID